MISATLQGCAFSRFAVWATFLLVHAWLWWLNLAGPGNPIGDVPLVYEPWANAAAAGDFYMGIDRPWVYPLLAFIPMTIPLLLGPGGYVIGWLLLITAGNAALITLILGRRLFSAGRFAAAWWWTAFLTLLGPIALARIDSAATVIAAAGMLLLANRPRVAATLATVAMWIKVWPAAILAAAFLCVPRRHRILMPALIVSGVVIAVALIAGAGSNVLGFITQQTGRGIQVESPVASIWLWLHAAGVPGIAVYYDTSILTFQVTGAGAAATAEVMTPLMVIVTLAVVASGIVASRRGTAFVVLFPTLSLAIITTLIAFNKVGSPQFIGWLAAPVILGLIWQRRSWAIPAVVVLVIAICTQLIYPFLYGQLLDTNTLPLLILAIRNLLELGLLGWSVHALIRCRANWRVVPAEQTTNSTHNSS